MIRVTRLDRHEVVLNCDLIESVDARPDTTIRLVTGQSQVVRESVEDVLARIREWRASVLAQSGLAGLLAHPITPVLRAPLAAALAEAADESDTEILAA
jgi:flagellar protein FlbD